MVGVPCEREPTQRRTPTFIHQEVFAQPIEICWFYKKPTTAKVMYRGQEPIFGINLQLGWVNDKAISISKINLDFFSMKRLDLILNGWILPIIYLKPFLLKV